MKQLFRAALIGALLASPVAAAPTPPAQLNQQQQAELQRVQEYLNGIRTMTARFTQYGDNGAVATGTLYLSRPGNLRFEYDPPTPILLVADGNFMIYHDTKLDQVTYLPLGWTPAWFLLRNDIRLGGDVTVRGFEQGSGAIRVNIIQTKEPDAGSVTLTLSDRPVELKQWTIVDPQGKKATVVLSDVRIGVPVDKKLFVFRDPRIGKGNQVP
jgi:outer membrane lipoprotein-sorting protein